MRSSTRQFDIRSWPILTGPIVVFARGKNVMKSTGKTTAGYGSARSRDGPIIYHMRDGPPNVTGPPVGTGPFGTGPPEIISSGFSPPGIKGQPMEWLTK